MTTTLFDRIMKADLESATLSVLDIERVKVIGKHIYDGSNLKTFKEKLALYLIQEYRKRGFKVSIPTYKNEYFTLLAEKGSEKILLHLVLDSEEERVAWRLSELKDNGYKLIIVRDRNEDEVEGVIGESLCSVLVGKSE